MKKLLAIFTLILLIPFAANAANPTIIMNTSKGKIILELYPQKAPKTVANFLTYIKKDGFKETTFHRVIKDFMIQGGGFKVSGGKASTLTAVENESKNGLSNARGTIAMARTNNPNSATRQFFINHKDNLFLDAKGSKWGYTVFGKVTAGMQVVDDIANAKTNSKDKPREAIIIKSITLLEKLDKIPNPESLKAL